ncbi:small acid-soluble spore protein Tlp [Solibacillus sp. MA9]|uniref:Small acid-soluble spore protein Tlp n=1 Tax=Solibacillus palustris TaxID=2908203 RepID=A0ABS9UGG8_9BACL|nr:small acid-soluble spore protein Tlp [Solibacillus sp. MA9]MCH7323184.1 small acid-soluble spore protein Tlp [Solibacillus sp. MA9]
MANSKYPKQDDKTSNVNRIREIVQNTERNLMEAEIGKEFTDGIQREIINEQNERRKQSIEELKEEIKEEIGKGKKGKA